MTIQKTMTMMFTAIAIATGATQAQDVHEGDVEIEVDGGTLVTEESVVGAEFGEFGDISPDAEGFDDDDFIGNPIAAHLTNEPGFDTEPGTFGSGESLTLRMLGDLLAWDGSGLVGTGTLGTETEHLQISFLSGFSESNDPGNRDLTVEVNSDGSWHKHFSFGLFPHAEDGDAGTIADVGVYAIELQLLHSGSLSPSDPFWIVFNFGDTEVNHDAAIESLEAAVPTPSAAGMMLVLGALTASRRRVAKA